MLTHTHAYIYICKQLHNIRFVSKRLITCRLFGKGFQERGNMNISC